MKRCASCGHPEIDHEGLDCRSREDFVGEECGCAGFEDPDLQDAFATAPIDAALRDRVPPQPKLPVDENGEHAYTWA